MVQSGREGYVTRRLSAQWRRAAQPCRPLSVGVSENRGSFFSFPARIQPRMRLTRLSLTDFRNFASLQIEVPPGPILLVGANAQGKTSLLEAIYYLVGASSPHASADRELIRLESLPEAEIPVGRVVAEVERAGGSLKIEIRVILDTLANGTQRTRKQILVNGRKRRAADLYGQFNAVLFLPHDVEIVEGSPSRRRRQLDDTLSQADPQYARTLSEYGKVLTRRNALLKQLQERRTPRAGASGRPDELSFWDQRLAKLAAQVVRRRAAALAELQALAGPIHARLSRGAEQLALRYEPSFPEAEGSAASGAGPPVQDAAGTQPPQEAAALAEAFTAELQRRRSEQIRRGLTTFGPQRDDLAFVVDGRDLRTYGSRGQNRTAILAYKLAEIEWIKQRRGELPVLLLDEVLAELDPERRADLLQQVLQAPQALLTGADLEMFEPEFRERATLWQVAGGGITKAAA